MYRRAGRASAFSLGLMLVAVSLPGAAVAHDVASVPLVVSVASTSDDSGLAHPDVAPVDAPDTLLVETPVDAMENVEAEDPTAPVPELADVVAQPEDTALAAVAARGIDLTEVPMLAVTWTGPQPDRIEIRALDPQGVWSEWSVLDGDQDADGTRGGSDPWWTGGADRAEVRSWRDGAPADDQLTLVAITPQESTTDTELPEAQGIDPDTVAAAPSAPVPSPSTPDAAPPTSTPDPSPSTPGPDPAPPTEAPAPPSDASTTGGSPDTITVEQTSFGTSRPATTGVAQPRASQLSTALAAPLASAGAAPATPMVITRDQWGADPAIMTWNPQYTNTTMFTVLHHTAGSNGYTAAQSAQIVRGIYQYHAISRGWGDIGYNVLVDAYGQVFEGRAGGLTRSPVGAHAGGFNSGGFGVSMLGTFDSVQPTEAMKAAVARIVAWKMGGNYHFNAWEVVNVVASSHSNSRWAAGQTIQMYRVVGHRDLGMTACPGNAGYSFLPDLRNRVNTLTAVHQTPIWGAWLASGGWASPWGAPRQVETNYWNGSATTFANGHLATYTANRGVIVIPPNIHPGWVAGGDYVGLGYPLAPVFSVGDGRGTAQEFPEGSVIHTSRTGSHAIKADMRSAWWATGGATGSMGYPTRTQGPVGDGRGVFIEFENHASLLWSPQTGVKRISGDARREWWRTGGTLGALGYPTRDQAAVGDGRGQFVEFEKGASIVWSPTTGARTLTDAGGVRSKWWATGGAAGGLGYPTRSQGPVGDGRGTFAEFENAGSILTTQATGAHTLRAGVRDKWWRSGGANGLGYPVTDTLSTSDGVGLYNDFERYGVTIVWGAQTGAHTVWGPIRDAWRAAGEVRTVGYPLADPVNFGSRPGGYSAFSSGAWVVWSETTGAHVVSSAMRSAWDLRGGATGSYGLPTGPATVVNGRQSQGFQGGTISIL